MKQTRERILASATALFARQGVRATSVRDITEACGLSKGALYNHFPSKEAVLSSIIEEHILLIESELNVTFSIENAEKRFMSQLRIQFDLVSNHHNFYLILYQERYFWMDDKMDGLLSALDRRFINAIQSTIRQLYSDLSQQQAYNLSFLINAQLLSYMMLLIEGKRLHVQNLILELRFLLDDTHAGLIDRQSPGVLPLHYFKESIEIDTADALLSQIIEHVSRYHDGEKWLIIFRHIQSLDWNEQMYIVKSTLESLEREPSLNSIQPLCSRLIESLPTFKS